MPCKCVLQTGGMKAVARASQSFVWDVQQLTAGLAVHRIRIVAHQTAGRAFEAHFGWGEQRAQQIEEQRHTEQHDDDRDQPPGRALQRDIPEARRGQRRDREIQRVGVMADLRIGDMLRLVTSAVMMNRNTMTLTLASVTSS